MPNQQEVQNQDPLNLPPGAPIPPTETGTHATDAQGIRKYDTEDLKPHGLDPKASKKKSKTSPSHGFPPAVSTTTQVNNHRLVSSSLPRFEVRHPAPNFYIPCFASMYIMLAAMNDKVCSLRPYSDSGSVMDWIPQMSTIVFSVLAYVQTLRAAQFCNLLNAEQCLFLQQFISAFKPELIEIPGPLVPFFKALSVSNPGFGNYENVCPAIPELTCREDHFYTLEYLPPNSANIFTGIDVMLPHLPLMFDQFIHLLKYLVVIPAGAATPPQYSKYEPLRRIFDTSTPAAGTPLAPYHARMLRSVGFSHRPTASNGLMARFSQYFLNNFDSFPAPWAYDPARAGTPATTGENPTAAVAPTWRLKNNLIEFLGFMHSSSWFSIFLRGMNSFNKHFIGNSSLLDIHPFSSTASLIIFKEIALVEIPNRDLLNRDTSNKASHRLEFDSSAESACPYIVEEDFQDSQVAQVNINCPHVFNNNMRIGDLQVTHFGDFFRLNQPVFKTNRGNLMAAYQTMFTSPSYFRE